jgi:hypothetical protein
LCKAGAESVASGETFSSGALKRLARPVSARARKYLAEPQTIVIVILKKRGVEIS